MNETIMSFAVSAFIILLGWCSKLLTEFIRAKVSDIQNKQYNDNLKNCIKIASDVAINVVETLDQTMVEKLKSAHADGKLDQKEIADIKSTALNMMTTIIPNEVENSLLSAFGDIEAYFCTLIESAVYNNKHK